MLVKMIEIRTVVVYNCEHLFDRWVYLRFYARMSCFCEVVLVVL